MYKYYYIYDVTHKKDFPHIIMSIMNAEIYLILSGKGGVGKTTLFSNLATSIAKKGYETIVLDADLAMSNLGLVFGLYHVPVTLHDVLAGKAPIDNAVYEGPHGVKVIPGGDTIEAFQAADPYKLIDVINDLKQKADYLLIDTTVGISEDILLLLPLADHIFIIVTPDMTSLVDALRMKCIAQSMECVVDGVILNRVDQNTFKEAKAYIDTLLEQKIVAMIPEDAAVRKSVAKSIPVVVFKRKSPASLAINKLASDIIRARYPDNKKAGFFQRFFHRSGRKST